MDHVARSIQLDVDLVKRVNLYKQGDISYNVSDELDTKIHHPCIFEIAARD